MQPIQQGVKGVSARLDRAILRTTALSGGISQGVVDELHELQRQLTTEAETAAAMDSERQSLQYRQRRLKKQQENLLREIEKLKQSLKEKAEIARLYKIHNPSKLKQIPTLIGQFGTTVLLHAVREKYLGGSQRQSSDNDQVPVATLTKGLHMVQQVYSMAPIILGRKLPESCSRKLLMFFESANEALVSAVASPSAASSGNTIGTVPGSWLGVLAKLEAAIELSKATHVRIIRHDNGFFANFLQVLDALTAAVSATEVSIDWRLDGSEKHFTYGSPGDDLWQALFEPVRMHSRADDGRNPDDDTRASSETDSEVVVLSRRLNMLLCSVYRGLFSSSGNDVRSGSDYFKTQRMQYHSIYSRYITIKNPQVQSAVNVGRNEMDRACGSRRGFRVGVHKRVRTPAVIKAQSAQVLPETAQYIAAAQAILAAEMENGGSGVIMLATDDEQAVTMFTEAFKGRCVFRSGVTRTQGGVAGDFSNEVHNVNGGTTCSVQDAVDVLIDALLLAECDVCIHADSNVTAAAAIMNPGMRMVHVLASDCA